MLTRIVYASHAADGATADIPGILAWSHRVNPELEVTGMLCFLDGVYMQYLEGEDTTLDALFSSIRVDARHRDVTLLERRGISSVLLQTGRWRCSSGTTTPATSSEASRQAVT